MNSQKGFATVLLMTLVPVLLAFAGVTLFTFSILKQDLGTMNVCRAVELNVQDKVGKVIGKLLGLNPRALRLRASEQAAKRRLNMAIMRGQPPAIAAAEAALLMVQAQRRVLGMKQDGLISSGNALLSTGAAEAVLAIQNEWNAHQKPVRHWLSSVLVMAKPRFAQIAMVPDFPDTAPVYEPAPDFEERQTWLQSWSVRIQLVGPMKSFLSFATQFQRSCSTSLYEEGSQWIGKLKRATSEASVKNWKL